MIKAYPSIATHTGDNLHINLWTFVRISRTSVPITPTAPTSPTGLLATKSSTVVTTIVLTWYNTATNATGIKIERKSGVSDWVQVASVGAALATYTDVGLLPSTTYYYRIQAYNAGGNSAYSNTASATTGQTVPANPSDLYAVPDSATSVTLGWADNSTNETAFYIERKTTSTGTWSQIYAAAADATSYTDTTVAASTVYYYRVRAHNTAGNSGYSGEASCTTPGAGGTNPATPVGATALATSSTGIDLTWTAGDTTEDGFVILRKSGATGTYTTAASTSAGVVGYSDAGLSPNTTYYYKVYAYNEHGNSGYSNECSAITEVGTPTAPSNLTVTGVWIVSASLAWTGSDTSVTSYTLQRKTGSGGTWADVTSIAYPTATYMNRNLTAGTTYYWRVKAVNSAGSSDWSNEASVTTETDVPTATPDAPTGFTATMASASQIDLDWAHTGVGVSGFRIERQAASETSYTQIASVESTAREYSDTGLSGNTAYSYRMRAWNGNGNSDYTDAASATTDVGVPTAPSDLIALATADTTVSLIWTDNSSDETAFKIQRKTGTGGVYAQIDTSTLAEYDDSGLTAGTTYVYRVCATNSAGDSGWSNEASVTTSGTPTTTIPTAPSDLYCQAVSSSSVTMTWTDNSDNEADFVIQRKSPTAAYATVASVNANETDWTDTGLSGDTLYTYKVAAHNSAGTSDYCTEASATTLPGVPLAPTQLIATTYSAVQINLSWILSTSPNQTAQKLKHTTSLAGTWTSIDLEPEVSTYELDGLNEGVTYYFRVYAVNIIGDSEASNTASAQTDSVVVPPPDQSVPVVTPDSFYDIKPAFATIGGMMFWTTKARQLRKFDGKNWYYFGIKTPQAWAAWKPELSFIKEIEIFCQGTIGAAELTTRYTITTFAVTKYTSGETVEVGDIFWRKGFPAIVSAVTTNLPEAMLSFTLRDFDTNHLVTEWDESLLVTDLCYFTKGSEIYDGASDKTRPGSIDGPREYRITFDTLHNWETNWCENTSIAPKEGQVKINLANIPYLPWYIKYINIYRSMLDAPGVFYLVDSIPVGPVAGRVYFDEKWTARAADYYPLIWTNQINADEPWYWWYDIACGTESQRLKMVTAASIDATEVLVETIKEDGLSGTPDLHALVVDRTIPGSVMDIEFRYDWLQARAVPTGASYAGQGCAFGFLLTDPWKNTNEVYPGTPGYGAFCKDAYNFVIGYNSVTEVWTWYLYYMAGASGDESPVELASGNFDLAPIDGYESFDPGDDLAGDPLPLWYSDRSIWRIHFNSSTGDVYIYREIDGINTLLSYVPAAYPGLYMTAAMIVSAWPNNLEAAALPTVHPQYRLFRIYSGGFVYYDNKPDEELGHLLHEWKIIPDGADDLCAVRDYLCVAYGSSLYISEPGDPETIYFQKIFEQPIVAIDSVSGFDDVIVLLKNKIYRVNVDDKSSILVSERMGAVGKNAVVNVGGRLIFIGQGGIYQFDGATISDLGNLWKVRDLFLGRAARFLNLSGLREANLLYRKKHNQIWAVLGEGAGTGDFVLCYDIEKEAYTIFSLARTLGNITAASIFDYGNDEVVAIATLRIVSINPTVTEKSVYVMSDLILDDDGVTIPWMIEAGEIGILDAVARFRQIYAEVVSHYGADLTVEGCYDRDPSFVGEGTLIFIGSERGEEQMIELFPEVVATYQLRLSNNQTTDLKIKRFGLRYQQFPERKRINK